MLEKTIERKNVIAAERNELEEQINAAIEAGDYDKADGLAAKRAGYDARIEVADRAVAHAQKQHREALSQAEAKQRAKALKAAQNVAATMQKRARELDTAFEILERASNQLFEGIADMEGKLREAGLPNQAQVSNRMNTRLLNAFYASAPELADRFNVRRVAARHRIPLARTLEQIMPVEVKKG